MLPCGDELLQIGTLLARGLLPVLKPGRANQRATLAPICVESAASVLVTAGYTVKHAAGPTYALVTAAALVYRDEDDALVVGMA